MPNAYVHFLLLSPALLPWFTQLRGHLGLGRVGEADPPLRPGEHSAVTTGCNPQQPGTRQPSDEPVYTSAKAQGEPWSIHHLLQLGWLEAASSAQGRPWLTIVLIFHLFV